MRERSGLERELNHLGLVPGSAGRWGPGETPPQPIRLDHYHVRKHLDPSVRALVSDPSPGLMTPARMAPGYVAVADARRQDLQRAVKRLVAGLDPALRAPRLRFRLALVDLTEAKHHGPVFAGHAAFNPGSAVEGASLTKILALYALFQLRFDLATTARLQDIRNAAALRAAMAAAWKAKGLARGPGLTTLFRFEERAGSPVTAHVRVSTAVHSNWVSRALILALGFEYIGSVALQSGLFDEAQGGLWLNAAYEKPRVTWTSSPFPRLERHNATALSVATFFTLLAQGRLADQATSSAIVRELGRVKCMRNGLLDGIATLPGVSARPPNKCGLLAPLFHDAVHVVRQVPSGRRLEYVAVVLSEEPPELDFTRLGIALDGLIAAANP